MKTSNYVDLGFQLDFLLHIANPLFFPNSHAVIKLSRTVRFVLMLPVSDSHGGQSQAPAMCLLPLKDAVPGLDIPCADGCANIAHLDGRFVPRFRVSENLALTDQTAVSVIF